ncbi:MAG: DHH family phosphoesterase [Oscillospiraceae bacterium]
MKKRGRIWNSTTLILLLLLLCLALAGILAVASPAWLPVAGGVVLVVGLLVVLSTARLRKWLRRILNSKGTVDGAEQGGLAQLNIPVMVVSGKQVVWYNQTFRKQITGGDDIVLLPVNKVVPGLDLNASGTAQGQDLEVGGALYTAYSSYMNAEKTLYFVVLAENTLLKKQAAEYLASMPAVLYIVIDTYDEMMKELRESAQLQLLSQVDAMIEKYVRKRDGFMRRITSSRYIAVVEERHLQNMVESKFDILDTVRALGDEKTSITLSVGVGHKAKGYKDADTMAVQALDMALGRGGDQVAVKDTEGFSFYGGVSQSVEKRERVKSRVIANSMKNLVQQSERVLVMGHKHSDMDSVGAAIGMLRFCKMCEKPASIVLDVQHTLSGSLLDLLYQAGYEKDIISPHAARPLAGEKTLLIIVDTHMPNLLESREIYQACKQVAIIDHHRKMVGHIDNATLFYHEPYASSASELVSELLQYIEGPRDQKPTAADAEALLAGIMLDTRTFSLHVGVRTFEAAAYLRRMGARTDVVKRLFASSMDDYVYRSHLVSEAEFYRGFAVVVSDELPADTETVGAQAANDLLTIERVKASIVAIRTGDIMRVSARSMGEMNVQLVMEKMGGGGHLTMAGAQLENADIQAARDLIMDAIDQYLAEAKQNGK